MSDADILFEQAKLNPTDETLLSAYSDALEEEGNHKRADFVRELVEKLRGRRQGEEDKNYTIPLMQYRLGLREIHINDFLYCSPDGTVFPVGREDCGYGGGTVGFAITPMSDDGTVQVWMRYGVPCPMRVQTTPRWP